MEIKSQWEKESYQRNLDFFTTDLQCLGPVGDSHTPCTQEG